MFSIEFTINGLKYENSLAERLAMAVRFSHIAYALLHGPQHEENRLLADHRDHDSCAKLSACLPSAREHSYWIILKGGPKY